MFTKLLVPVDIEAPDPAVPAVKAAAELAAAGGGDVRLVYVSPFLVDAALRYLPPDFFSHEEEEANAALAKMARAAGLPEDRTSTVTVFGSIHNLVLEEADKFCADLIVIGSALPSVSTYFLGSSASAILRHAACSVLVMRGEEARR